MGDLRAIVRAHFPELVILTNDYNDIGADLVDQAAEHHEKAGIPDEWTPDRTVLSYCEEALTTYLRDRYINGEKGTKIPRAHPEGPTMKASSGTSSNQ